MTWWDKVGENAKRLGNATGVSDLILEVSDVATGDNPEFITSMATRMGATPEKTAALAKEDSILGEVVDVPQAVGSAGWKSFSGVGMAYNEKVFQPVQDLGVFMNLAISAPLYAKGRGLDSYLGAAWDARDDTSWANSRLDTSLLLKATTGSAFDGYNPVYDPTGAKAVRDKSNIGWVTGPQDFAATIFMDPLTYIGAPVKAATAGMRGAQLVSDAEKAQSAWYRTAGLMSKTKFDTMLQTGKFDDSLRILTQSKDMAVNRGIAVEMGVHDPETFALITREIDNLDDTRDYLRFLASPQAPESLAIAERLKGIHGGDVHYYMQRQAGRDPLKVDMLTSPDDLLVGDSIDEFGAAVVAKADEVPENAAALARAEAFSRGIDKTMYDMDPGAQFRNVPTTNARVRGRQQDRAVRSVAGLSDEPIVTTYKPHRFHPPTWYVEKPAGLVNTESPQAFGEILAFFRQMDARTKGQFSKDHFQEFSDRWFEAGTLTKPASERGSIASGLNDTAVRYLAKKHLGPDHDPLDFDALATSAKKKSAVASAKMKEKGWLAMATGNGGVGILRHPLLERATDNTIPMYDVLAMDRTLGRLGKDGIAAHLTAARDESIMPMVDNLTAMWKVGVLFRLGYTIRNLTEASLSLAASGNLGTVMSEVGADRLGAWMRAAKTTSNRMIDKVGVARGIHDTPAALSDSIVQYQALGAATEAQVKAMSRQISQANIAKLANSGDPAKVARAEQLERIRAQMATEQVTYHATTPGDWAPAADRYLTTTPSLQVADFHATRVADTGVGPAGQTDIFEALTPGSARQVVSYGETLDLTTRAAHGFDPVLVAGARKGDRNAIQMLSDQAYTKGYGRITLPDAGDWGGVQVIVHPRAIGERGLQSEARRRVKAAADDAERSLANEPLPINPDFEEDLSQAMLDGGLEVFAQKLAVRRRAVNDQLDTLEAKYFDAAKRRKATAKHQAKAGHGRADVVSHNGVRYDQMPNAFEGHAGGMWEGQVGAGNTYKALAGDSEAAVQAGGRMSPTEVSPDNPRFFEAWANILNLHFRDAQSKINDVVVDKMLAGESFDDILDWALTTREGYNWTRSIGITRSSGGSKAEALAEMQARKINPDTVEQAVAGLMQATDLYLPKGVIRDAFTTKGDITADLLKMASAGKPLTPLRGLLIPTSAEARQAYGQGYTFHRGIESSMRVLGSLPESAFARHPLFASAFAKERRTRISLAEQNLGGRISVGDLERIDLAAKQAAERTVERTLFTITRRSALSGNAAMRTLTPFVSAWENVIQRWSRFVVQDPTIALRGSVYMAKLNQGATVVDEDGQPVTNTSEFTDGALLVLPGLDSLHLPGRWGKAAKLMADNTLVPVKSLDVMMQGQLDPGLGPVGVVPIMYLLKRRPSAEQYFKWALPYGVPEKYWDAVMPTALRRISASLTDTSQYTNSISKAHLMAQHLYEQDPINNPKPTITGAEKVAQSMTWLRAFTSATAPVAATYTNERDFYAGKYRTYTDQYGYEEGETRFFLDFPEAGLLVESLSKNPSGAMATPASVANAKKYRDEIATAYGSNDPEVAGFIMNYGVPEDAEFSQAAYQWERQNGPVDGSQETFRQVGNPQDQVREAHVREGWRLYREVIDGARAQLVTDGYVPEDKYYRDVMTATKGAVADHLQSEGNKDWYAEYKDPDTAKYMRRADAFKAVLSSEDWMRDHGNDPLNQSMATFLAWRTLVEQELAFRDQQGGSSTLTAAANKDLADGYAVIIERMKMDSPEFNTWHERYFANDSVSA